MEKHQSRKLKDLYTQMEKTNVVLPNFQRGYVWNVEQQLKLIASMIVKIPIGSTLHLKSNSDSYAARALCERARVIPSKAQADCEFVLDGQQRLSTLKNAFYNVYSSDARQWETVFDNLFSSLKIRWFLDFSMEENPLGFNNLHFDKELIETAEPRLIQPYLKYKKIFKKDKGLWFHPAFRPTDSNGADIVGANQKKLTIAKEMANAGLVPLYEIYLGSSGIHCDVLRLLAKIKLEELNAKIKDFREQEHVKEYAEFLIAIFHPIESEIEDLLKSSRDEDNEYYRFLEEEEEKKLLDQLQETWLSEVTTYLNALIDIEIPIIALDQKEAARASAIFEEINKQGTELSIFDLVVAKVANTENTEDSLTDKILKLLVNDKIALNEEELNDKDKKWLPLNMVSSKDSASLSKT